MLSFSMQVGFLSVVLFAKEPMNQKGIYCENKSHEAFFFFNRFLAIPLIDNDVLTTPNLELFIWELRFRLLTATP